MEHTEANEAHSISKDVILLLHTTCSGPAINPAE